MHFASSNKIKAYISHIDLAKPVFQSFKYCGLGNIRSSEIATYKCRLFKIPGK